MKGLTDVWAFCEEVTNRTLAAIIAHSIVAGTIFTTVAAIAVTALAYTTSLFSWLGASVPVWRWWYYLLIVWLSMSVAIYARRWWRSRIRLEHYTTDTLGGIVWRWKMLDGKPRSITPHCPTCDRELRLKKTDLDTWTDEYSGFDLNCPAQCYRQHVDGYTSLFDDRIEGEIELKIRNGKWRAVVEAQRRGKGKKGGGDS